jgi:hypothetical protein
LPEKQAAGAGEIFMKRNMLMTLTLLSLLSCETMGISPDDFFSPFQPENSSAAQNTTYPKIIEDIDGALVRYSPDSVRILDEVAKAERNSRKDQILLWYRPAQENGREYFYDTLDTSVHETNHKFTSLNLFSTASTNMQEQYLIEGKIIKVQHGASPVKTETVTGSLPARLRTFRWGTYVSPNAAPTANQHGIYGLLDEFNAYYRGLKAVYECFPYLSELNGFQDADTVTFYIGALATDGSSTGAFYEFKYWILRYLLHTKEKIPAQYRSILQNRNFLQVFLYIHDNFQMLVEEMIPERVNELILRMNEAGLKASLEDIRGIGMVFSVHTGSSSSRLVPIHDEAASAIRADMKQERYGAMLEELRDALARAK